MTPRKPKATATVETVTAWAWEIQDDNDKWVLCHWIMPTKQALLDEMSPSGEARAVRVHVRRARAKLRRKRVE